MKKYLKIKKLQDYTKYRPSNHCEEPFKMLPLHVHVVSRIGQAFHRTMMLTWSSTHMARSHTWVGSQPEEPFCKIKLLLTCPYCCRKQKSGTGCHSSLGQPVPTRGVDGRCIEMIFLNRGYI
jgi:hypothetical protein